MKFHMWIACLFSHSQGKKNRRSVLWRTWTKCWTLSNSIPYMLLRIDILQRRKKFIVYFHKIVLKIACIPTEMHYHLYSLFLSQLKSNHNQMIVKQEEKRNTYNKNLGTKKATKQTIKEQSDKLFTHRIHQMCVNWPENSTNTDKDRSESQPTIKLQMNC